MSQQAHYKPNLRDLSFNLFEFLNIGNTSLGKAPFGDFDETAARQTLETFAQIAVEQLALSFAEADHNPPKLDPETHEVALPPGMTAALNAYYEAGMQSLELPQHLGGLAAPPTLIWSAFELVVGANPPLSFYTLANLMARVLDQLATEDQRRRYLPQMVEKHWGATMVLTEPDAGSDVGNARAKARHIEGDVWEIEGVKRFITNGEFDHPENIVHLVLARPEGAGPGTKGLSLFIVPKYWVNEDGSLGERNGVICTNLEKKMGIKGSTTSEITFGDGKPARGLLMGNVHDGIRQMFMVIEQARMAIGFKSMSTLSTAYLHALEFAKERIQGSDLLESRNKAAPKVEIIRHPDVRRMLMQLKAHAEGMRALCLFAAATQDEVQLKGGHNAETAKEAEALNDLLLPLVKGYNSEKAYELLGVALQVHGGSGYLQDYPIEQYIRDQKIDSLYEGTTHIQAQDLIFRKIARDGGATLQGLLGRIRETAEGNGGGEALAAERAALGKALGQVEAMFGALLGKIGESLYHVGFQGNRVLMALAELVIGWLLVRHAEVALERVKVNPGDKSFYEGKVASARYFTREVLPNLTLASKLVQGSELSLMEISDDLF